MWRGKLYSNEYLQPYRNICDTDADELIAKINENENMAALRTLFSEISTNKDIHEVSFDQFNKGIADDVKAYFMSTATLPSWAKTQEFKRATELFEIYGPEMLMVLISYSLPFCYSCANGAQVLYQTGRLNVHDGSYDSFTRRLVETAQFVVNVLENGALTDDSKNGICSIQKVRLIHATIRSYILYKEDAFKPAAGYNPEIHGKPINQEDLAGTMLSFSVIIVRGIEKLGHNLTEHDKESFIHYWNVIGSMIGVDEGLLPENYRQAEALTDGILEHESKPSIEGHELTMACIGFMEHMVPLKRFENVPLALVNFFCGEEMAKLLAIPNSKRERRPIGKLMLKVANRLNRDIDRDHFVRDLSGIFSRHLVNGFLRLFNKGKSVQFQLPSALVDYGRPLEFEVKLPVGDEIKSVSHALYWIKTLCDYFKSTNHPLGYFAAVYYLVTKMVHEGIENKIFKDLDTIAKVDIAFMSRYFDALNKYFEGVEPTQPWKLAFEGCDMEGLFIDQYIFVCTVAHMDYDLSIGVAEVCGDKIDDFEDDFNLMNDLFGKMYDQMNTDVAEIWRGFDWLYDKKKDQILAFEAGIMKKFREEAWERACNLAKTNNKEAVIAEFEPKVLKMGNDVIHPPEKLDKLFKHFAKKEKGTVAEKIDIMLRTDLISELNK